ncbi:MAG: glycosyltransferase, partial [Candidatus Omnitrophota bacterium]|nr:glycosyltransferase [Candidatus Omnitrophota bacterium]
EAAAMVIKDNPCLPVKFKIIGDGELKKDLEEYAQRLNINNWVDFLGWQKDLAGIYANLDVVALTSMNEGTPVSLIEAMASGRAVVATGVGGVRDLLGKEISAEIKTNANFRVMERGIIVEPGDSFSFAAAITFILQNNSVRKNIQERGRDFAKDRFTRERLIRDVENLYNKIAISFKLG